MTFTCICVLIFFIQMQINSVLSVLWQSPGRPCVGTQIYLQSLWQRALCGNANSSAVPVTKSPLWASRFICSPCDEEPSMGTRIFCSPCDEEPWGSVGRLQPQRSKALCEEFLQLWTKKLAAAFETSIQNSHLWKRQTYHPRMGGRLGASYAVSHTRDGAG